MRINSTLVALLLTTAALGCKADETGTRSGYLQDDAGGAGEDERDAGPDPERDATTDPDVQEADASPAAEDTGGSADSGSADGGADDGGADDASPEGDATPSDASLQPHPLGGHWMLLQVNSALSEVPMLGELRNETISLGRVSLEESPAGLLMRREVCAIEIRSESNLVTTIIPDLFVASLEESVRPVSLSVDDRFDVPRFLEVRGAHLDDPENDPLPSDPADPRLFDQDGDGHPGLTVSVTGLVDGEIYVVQRGWDRLEGQVHGVDEVEGLVTWDDEQNILGTDNPLLASGAPSRPDPEASNSYFRMLRLEVERSCPWITEHAPESFPELR